MPTLATLKQIAEFFEMSGSELRADLTRLTEADKMDLRTGLGDGTLDYAVLES